jgi:predicted nucleotidyltransferase
VSEAFGFREILEVLTRHGVEFVVVGGLAGVLHGSPIPTRDVDVVHARTPANVARLLAALQELHATYRNDPRGLSPGESHLQGPGHQLLATRFGQLDVLGALGQGLEHPQLAADAVEFDLGGVVIRVVSLDRLIQIKAALDRPKDKLHLLQLLALRRERERKG